MNASFVCPVCGLEWKMSRLSKEGMCLTCLRYKIMHRRLYGQNAKGVLRYVRACVETEAYYRKHSLGGYNALDWHQWLSWLAEPNIKPAFQERVAV